MERRGWWVLALVSLTGGLVGTLAIVKALFLVNFDQLSVVVLLQKLQPLFAISLAAVLLRERITPGVSSAGPPSRSVEPTCWPSGLRCPT